MNKKFNIFDNNIMTYRLENHSQIKDKILSYIEKQEKYPINKEGYSITYTDYMTKTKPIDREYFKLLKNQTNFFEDLRTFYRVNDIELSNIWYQQYYENDKHQWHYHNYANLLCVYLLELKDNDGLTQFYDLYKNKPIDIDAKEGDIIVFNSLIPHRSPPLKSKHRKTAISINLNILDINSNLK